MDTDENLAPQPLPRFFIFAGNSYYPQGGAQDLVGVYGTLEEMEAEVERVRRTFDWADFMELTSTGFVNAI